MPIPNKDEQDAPVLTYDYMEYNDSKAVKINDSPEPQFIRDVVSYFLPSVVYIGVYIAFWSTGNMLVGAWLMYIGTPLYNYFFLYDDHNIARKNEKAWINCKLFLIPMYTFELLQTLSWIYCMMLFSTKYQPDYWIFQMKPETTAHTILFYFVVGFFAGVSSTAGHELLHYKHWIHKVGGSIPYA